MAGRDRDGTSHPRERCDSCAGLNAALSVGTGKALPVAISIPRFDCRCVPSPPAIRSTRSIAGTSWTKFPVWHSIFRVEVAPTSTRAALSAERSSACATGAGRYFHGAADDMRFGIALFVDDDAELCPQIDGARGGGLNGKSVGSGRYAYGHFAQFKRDAVLRLNLEMRRAFNDE